MNAILLHEAAERLYNIFAKYDGSGHTFCGRCHYPEDVKYYTNTPLRDLDPDKMRDLIAEPSDHWEKSEYYRHYLPRILEVMGPPWKKEDIYTPHILETLLSLGFYKWQKLEKDAVLEDLQLLESTIDLSDEEDNTR